MRVSVLLEGRFSRTNSGEVCSGAAFPYAFWRRYLEVFDRVTVVARIKEGEARGGDVRSDGPGVTFAPIPYYVGPWQYLEVRGVTRTAVQAALRDPGAVIMRVGSELANLAWPMLVRAKRPYGLEVVGDPWDVFAPGVVRHPLRPFLRRYFWWQLRRQCASAAAVAYVTEKSLQERYPMGEGHATSHSRAFVSSDVVVPEGESGRFDHATAVPSCRLVFVGSLEQLYKGPDVLLRALAACFRRGVTAELRLVGDGRHRANLVRLAERLGVAHAVEFVGTVTPGEAVYRELRKADVFILPSRTEGLPRALIEAMALGLPCIATSVGGIPELLAPEDLVSPGDVNGLADQIQAVLASPARRRRMSERNRLRAADFSEPVLAGRRRAFYACVREATEGWLAGTAAEGRS